MGNKKRKETQQQKEIQQQKLSMISISGVIVAMAIILFVACGPIHTKNDRLREQESKLQAEIEKEADRTEEIDEIEEYVKTDEYVKDVSKDKLGMAEEGEIIIREEP